MKHQGQNIPMKIIQKTQKQNKTSAIPYFTPQILLDDEVTDSMNSLNKAKEVINVVHTWAKGYIKNNGQNDEPTHIFFSGIGVTGKSPLVKNIYNAISITLLYHIKELEKPRVLLLRLQ